MPTPSPQLPAALEKPPGAWLVGVSQLYVGEKQGANRKMRFFQRIDSVTVMVQIGRGCAEAESKRA